MKITVAMLRKKNDCANQLEKFKELFPDGVEVSKELCLLHAQTSDFDWAARNLLPADRLEAYDDARALAWKAWKEARALAFAAACEGL